MLFRAAFACALLLALAVHAEVPADEIKSLPGWDGALPTRQWSGFININEATGKFLHYWCSVQLFDAIEHCWLARRFVQSENAPATAPLVVWMNGVRAIPSLS